MKSKENKGKSITFRLNQDLYEKCVENAINRSIKEKRIVKVSEIIREILEKELSKGE